MSYFSKYRIQEHQPKVAVSTVRELQCPVLQSGWIAGEPEEACSAPELFDWLGAVFCNAELWVYELWSLLLVFRKSSVIWMWLCSGCKYVFFSFYGRNNQPYNFISTYCCPQPSTVIAQACLCTITGFILPEKIHVLLEQLW